MSLSCCLFSLIITFYSTFGSSLTSTFTSSLTSTDAGAGAFLAVSFLPFAPLAAALAGGSFPVFLAGDLL